MSARRESLRSQITPSKGRPPPPSRKSSKAQYQPLTSAQGRWPASSRVSLQNSTRAQSRLTALQEDDDLTLSEYSPSVAPPRESQNVPSSPRTTSNIASIKQYLEGTEIEEVFSKLVQLLLSLTDLPYNPYPGFTKRLRLHAERFHLMDKTTEEILSMLSSSVKSGHLGYLYHPAACDFAHGLKNIVEIVEPKCLKDYLWLFDTLRVQQSRAGTPKGYSNQTMLALIGPAVFHGPLYLSPTMLTVRVEYLITGPNMAVAVELFIDSVVLDILQTETEKSHILLGVKVPIQSETEAGVWVEQYWTYEKLANNQKDFKKSVTEAVVENQYVCAECVFCLDPHETLFRKGQKQYGLNFILVLESGENKGVTYFTEYPLITLHEGVFLKSSHAEAYLSTYTARLLLMDKQAEDNSDRGKTQPTKAKIKQQSGQLTDEAVTKVRIDGFRLDDSPVRTPEASQVTAPIISSWQHQIAQLDMYTDIFEIIDHVLFLVVVDKEAYNRVILVEIYRFLHGSAARLYILMQHNKTIRELLLKLHGMDESELVTMLFGQYKQGIAELFNGSLQERSSDLLVCAKAIDSTLEMISNSEENFLDGVPLTKKTTESLKNINSYCYTILLGLVEDALDSCPNLKSLIQNIKTLYSDDVVRPKTGIRDRTNKKKTGVRAGAGEETYKHGMEDDTIIKHDKQVVNVEMCIERDTAPKVIAVEAVLLRYIIDTHLDEMWPTFLLDLVSGTMLPPNPYPRLVSVTRQAAMRMDLCFEKKEQLTSRLMPARSRIEDPVNFVSHIPGCDAHGLPSAMMFLNTEIFSQLTPLVSPYIQTDFKLRHGPYRIAICCAVSGFTPLYGDMDPYLNQIDLHEHCYIRGPEGCWGDATQVHSKLVYDHLKVLYKEHKHLMVGLYLGDPNKSWPIEQVLNRKKGFALEFERHCQLHEPVFIKLYVRMGWRLVPVVKYFMCHFINDEETEHDTMFHDNPANLYQNIFFSQERAAFHFQYGGPPDRSDPYNLSNIGRVGRAIDDEILHTCDQQDWVNVYRWLLLKNTISQGSSVVAEAWRMMHSTARQVEYVNVLGRSLQDLIQYAMVLEKRLQDPETDYYVTSKDDEQNTLFRLEQVMGQMVMAYRQKVASLCSAQCAMVHQATVDTITSKLQSITERDVITRELFLLKSVKSVFVLEEVISMLRALQDGLAYDVHAVCTEGQAMLRSVQAEVKTRPHSVASYELRDHLEYVSRPPARYADHVNDWADF